MNGKTSGVVPFIRVMDSLTLAISQGSLRRGSAAVYLPVNHPEIEEFIEIRRPTGGDPNRKALNLHHGLLISDAFMRAVEADEEWALVSPKDGAVQRKVSARHLWIRILTARIETGEPYLIFVDHVNKARPEHHKLAGLEVKTSNLCSEITLPTGVDHHGKQRTAVCCLSSLNLETYLEWHEHPTFIEDVMRFLDNVLQDFIDNAGTDFATRDLRRHARALGRASASWASTPSCRRNNVPLESGDGQGVEQEDVQAHPRPVRRRLQVARRGARRLPGCRRLRLRGALLQQARDRADRLDLDHLRRRLARHRAVGGQRLQPQDPVGLVRGAQPVPGEDARRRRAGTTRTPGPRSPSARARCSISTASTTRRRRCSRRRSRSTSAGWSSTRADRAPFICQSQSLNIFLPADVHKRDLHQIHMMAWKRGVKSLYYCRSLSIQRAETVAGEALMAAPLRRPSPFSPPRVDDAPSTVPLVPPAAPQQSTDYEECLSCQ